MRTPRGGLSRRGAASWLATVAMARRKVEEEEGEKVADVAAALADAGDPLVHVVRVRERGVRRSCEKGGKQRARGLAGLAARAAAALGWGKRGPGKPFLLFAFPQIEKQK